jgi:hypothetical protein
MDNDEKMMQQIMEMLAEMNAKLDSNQKKTEATDFRVNPENMEPNPKENEAVLERQRVHNDETAIHSLNACRSETMECQQTTEERLEYEEPDLGDLKDDRNETTACNEAKEKINPGMMQSTEEHQDVHNEDVAVMPVGELRKWRRVWKTTAGRHG